MKVFCFLFGQDDDGDGGFDVADQEAAAPGGDFTQVGFPLSQNTTLGDSSQGLSFTSESGVDQTMFAGDGLVAQPNKVRLDWGKVLLHSNTFLQLEVEHVNLKYRDRITCSLISLCQGRQAVVRKLWMYQLKEA